MERIALIVHPNGSLEVRKQHEGGYTQQLAFSGNGDLGGCLLMAAACAGHPLVLPISGPDTQL